MLVHALITSIRTHPEPTVFLVLDGLNEVLADLVSRRPRVPVLAKNNRTKLRFVPLLHGVGLLLLVFRLSGISVKILLGRLTIDI